jgi:hypothetical protein
MFNYGFPVFQIGEVAAVSDVFSKILTKIIPLGELDSSMA